MILVQISKSESPKKVDFSPFFHVLHTSLRHGDVTIYYRVWKSNGSIFTQKTRILDLDDRGGDLGPVAGSTIFGPFSARRRAEHPNSISSEPYHAIQLKITECHVQTYLMKTVEWIFDFCLGYDAKFDLKSGFGSQKSHFLNKIGRKLTFRQNRPK